MLGRGEGQVTTHRAEKGDEDGITDLRTGLSIGALFEMIDLLKLLGSHATWFLLIVSVLLRLLSTEDGG